MSMICTLVQIAAMRSLKIPPARGSWPSVPIVGIGAKPSTSSGGSGKSGNLGKFLLLGKFGK